MFSFWRAVRGNLDLLTNIAILATCGVVLTAILAKRAARVDLEDRTVLFASGDPAPKLSGVSYAEAETVLMFLRSTCRFCTESMPFYQSLTPSDPQRSVRLVAVGPEPVDVLRRYLDEHSVRVDGVISDGSHALPTPTLLLVDRRGRVKKAWVGQQGKDAEESIRAAIGVGTS